VCRCGIARVAGQGSQSNRPAMSSDDDDLNKELLQVAGGRAAGGKRGRAAASASEESLSEEVNLHSHVLLLGPFAWHPLVSGSMTGQSTAQNLTAE
jgi:hypothetical protein